MIMQIKSKAFFWKIFLKSSSGIFKEQNVLCINQTAFVLVYAVGIICSVAQLWLCVLLQIKIWPQKLSMNTKNLLRQKNLVSDFLMAVYFEYNGYNSQLSKLLILPYNSGTFHRSPFILLPMEKKRKFCVMVYEWFSSSFHIWKLQGISGITTIRTDNNFVQMYVAHFKQCFVCKEYISKSDRELILQKFSLWFMKMLCCCVAAFYEKPYIQ